jgi:hypothetical protein
MKVTAVKKMLNTPPIDDNQLKTVLTYLVCIIFLSSTKN